MAEKIKCDCCSEETEKDDIIIKRYRYSGPSFLCKDCAFDLENEIHADYDECPSCGGAGACISCNPGLFI